MAEETARRSLEQALAALPTNYPGPGGAVAVLREGEVLARHTWGYADVERHIPFTPQTMFRICSISKQFTNALMLDRFADPTMLDADVAARLPLLEMPAPPALRLAHNQSGLRDYWATAMLCGSPVEAPFGEAEARTLIAKTRTLHFQPGTRYSYCNQNFRILGDVVADRCNAAFEDLLRKHVFDPAGMPTARLCADTSTMPDGTVGYEGDAEMGHRPAVNRIDWTGDAGLGMSLDDLIAWEKFFDANRDNAQSLPRRLAAPTTFLDGAPAQYGFGLSRMKLLGHDATGHGGGLRGWRSVRFYLPGSRISIVVLFNHMADPRAAALELLATLLDTPAKPDPAPSTEGWRGTYQEPETGLIVRLKPAHMHKMNLHYAGLSPEILEYIDTNTLQAGSTTITRDDGALTMRRKGDNQTTTLAPIAGEAQPDVTGTFHNAEYDCTFTCIDTEGARYGNFAGFLGNGTMQYMLPAGPDLWRLPMQRALDHAPPGDWTLQFHRNQKGQVEAVEIGCWLARRLRFEKASD